MLLEVQQPWRTPEQSYVEARDKKKWRNQELLDNRKECWRRVALLKEEEENGRLSKPVNPHM